MVQDYKIPSSTAKKIVFLIELSKLEINDVLDMYKKNVVMLAMLKNVFDMANSANEQGIANFVAERIDMHQKWQWQLGSSLQTAGMEIPSESSSEEIDEEMSGPMDSVEETATEIADSLESEEILIEDSAEPKELGKRLDVNTIEDAIDI